MTVGKSRAAICGSWGKNNERNYHRKQWNLKGGALLWELETDRVLSNLEKTSTGVATTDKLEMEAIDFNDGSTVVTVHCALNRKQKLKGIKCIGFKLKKQKQQTLSC